MEESGNSKEKTLSPALVELVELLARIAAEDYVRGNGIRKVDGSSVTPAENNSGGDESGG